MKITEKIKENQQKLEFIIYCVCMVAVAVMAFKVFEYSSSPKDVESSIELAKNKYQLDDEALKKYQEKYTKAADELKKASHLVPKPAKPTLPVCTAVMGNQAWINGKFYSVGDKVLGAKITDISPTGATIMWEGKPTLLAAFGKLNMPVASPSKGKDTRQRVDRRRPDADMPGPMRRQGGGRRGFMGMSPEAMNEMRQRYTNMSPEERQKAREEMRNGEGRGGRGRR